LIPLRTLIKARQGVLLDAISIFFIVSSFLFFSIQMFIFLPDISNPIALSMVMRCLICFSFLIGGIVLMMTTRTLNPYSPRFVDEHVSSDDMGLITVLTVIDLVMITLINFVTFQYTPLKAMFEITPNPIFSQVTFSFFVGITEEVVFRGALLTYASNISWSFVGIIISTLAWWAFHGGVYGLQAAPMTIIIGSGFVISASYVMAGNRLSVPMLPHGINNIGSYLAQTMIKTSPIASVVLKVIECLG